MAKTGSAAPKGDDLFQRFRANFDRRKEERMSLPEYLELCKADPMAYATAAERMVNAIGEPVRVDTSADPRLARIFMNRTLRIYPAFKDFFGMEEAVERIVGYFRHAAQGLEERKQVLYLLGPVGGGKSSLAERLKELMEVHPIYVLCAGDEMSPVFESPLGLFPESEYSDIMQEQFGIDRRYLGIIPSPWAIKRLKKFDGDLTKFSVAKVMPSRLEQIAVMKTEPGDENNQDISSLVGKTDIRMLERFAQNDPDAYSFSGALCRGNQGLVEFVEMFKAPIKTLHPLLTATQERNYVGTEAISAIPFNGIVAAHCFSDDTELLTESGWKLHNDIAIGDMLATMNPDTGALEYQPALRKFEQHFEGEMFHFRSDSADHLVTPNHKMLVSTSYTPAWRLVEAKDLKPTGNNWPVAAHSPLPDYPMTDDELRLMVWTVADGSIVDADADKSHPNAKAGYVVRFHLKKERKIERLTALLDRLRLEPAIRKGEETVNIAVRLSSPSKLIPDYYTKLSARQCMVVLEEFSHTDGSRASYEGDVTHFQLSSNVRANIDRLQHLAFASGSKANLCSHTKDRYTPQHFLSVRPGVTRVRGDHITHEVAYSGTVFCFETENHTLVARRNGKVLVTGNSNESEWERFKNNSDNEAFIDRVCIVKVPYCLRSSEEEAIYQKMLSGSDLKASPLAPKTLSTLAQFSVMSRLKEHTNSTLFAKMRVYDGQSLKETDPKAKSMQEYRDEAGVDEGMNGISTRFAFKVLSEVFNHDPDEISADPVHLMLVLEKAIRREQFSPDVEKEYLTFIKDELAPRYAEYVGDEIQTAYLEAYDDYGQNLFDRYIEYADHWQQEIDFKDADTGALFDRAILNAELEKIEKPAGIANPKDFRTEVVNYVLRQKAKTGKAVKWSSYEKLKRVIEKRMFANVADLLPIISFSSKSTKEDEKKHEEFVGRMVKKGYTPKQTRRLVEWYMRVHKSG